MLLGDDLPAVEAMIGLMRMAAGRYQDNRMVLYLTGVGDYNDAEMYVEEQSGRVRVFSPFVRFALGDRTLSRACRDLLLAYGIVGEPPPRPRDGQSYMPNVKPYEGQITLLLEGGTFTVSVVHPPNLPIEQHSLHWSPDETPEQRWQRETQRTLARSERFFGPGQVILTEEFIDGRVPPRRIDVRTELPVPWPDGEEPPPYDYANDPNYFNPFGLDVRKD